MKIPDGSTIYDDGLMYDLINPGSDDVAMYAGQIRQYGQPVLELGCGTGRLTIPLAQGGIEITGLDISTPLLKHAREKATALGLDILWVEADCRNFHLPRKFATVVYPFNAIAHLPDRASIEGCFGRVREHLVDDGRFIIDYLNPNPSMLARDPEIHYPVRKFHAPHLNADIEASETVSYDRASQQYQTIWHFKNETTGATHSRTIKLRMYFPQELEMLLNYNGFEIEHKYGDHDLAPFTSESRIQILVCKKKLG